MENLVKKNLILSLVFLFSSSLSAEEPLAQPFFGSMSQSFRVEDVPNIAIRIGKDKPVSCNLDTLSKIYLCKNSGKPILVKRTTSGFTALTKDSKKSVAVPVINHVEAGGKTLYEASLQGLKMPPVGTSELSLNTHNFRVIDDFFSYYDSNGIRKESNDGAVDYKKVYTSFNEEKKRIEKTFSEPNYLVELEDGKKIKCKRGTKRPYSSYGKSSEKYVWDMLQCGAFKCDPIKKDGKSYNVTMFYDSEEGSANENSIHLTDNNGLGPFVNIKKITTPGSSIPVVDNSIPQNPIDINIPPPPISRAISQEDNDKISIYKNRNFQDLMDHNGEVCNDEDNVISNLLDKKNKFLKRIAELEFVEFIQILSDGELTSEFVDPAQALTLGCLHEGVYYNKEAAKNLDKIKKKVNPIGHSLQTISLNRATELFNKALSMEDIPWSFTQDGCFARAHLMARRFEAEGVRVDKAWLKGELYIPDSDPLIEWKFHVAPMVYVEDGNGKVTRMIIDPSIFSKPVTVEEWDKKISKKTLRGSVLTAFPFPENAALLERASLSFSNSDPFLPKKDIDMTEEEKMEKAHSALNYFKTLETN